MDERIRIQARPPDRPGDPGRGRDLPSDLSQGEKRRMSDGDLPSNHSPSTSRSASARVSTAPNSSSLGVVPLSGVPSGRVCCPAQPVGYICLPHRQAPGLECPLGHAMERARVRSIESRPSTL